jgi:hypothetical protein
MNLLGLRWFALAWFCALFLPLFSFAQADTASRSGDSASKTSGSMLTLRVSSTATVASETGGAFMSPAKCDPDGSLYIRKFAGDRPLLGAVVKIGEDGKRAAVFDPAKFSQLGLERADAFSPAADGGIYRIAQTGGLKPSVYVLHFSSDGSASSSTRLDADFEVYTFAAFADGNFLLSGVRRDAQNKNDRGRNFTAVFFADGRELAQLSFPDSVKTPGVEKASPKITAPTPTQPKNAEQPGARVTSDEKPAPMLDLADAELGRDGYLYVMRGSSPAVVYAIASSGQIMKTIHVPTTVLGGRPSAFHVSGNRLAVSFQSEDSDRANMVLADAETGRKIAAYGDSSGDGTMFACYAADEGVFTFLRLGDGNTLEVIRAEAQ